jgi:hypothetical protein
MFRRSLLLLITLSALFLTFLAVQYRESRLPWKKIQGLNQKSPQVRELYLPHWKTRERCLTCHFGIEEISSSHPVSSFGCTICHGGNGLALEKDLAHQNLLGGSNPSDFRVVHLTCGRRAPDGTRCHTGHPEKEKNPAQTSPRSLMATMAGVIAGLRYTWGAQEQPEALYGSLGVEGENKKIETIPVFDRFSFRLDPRGKPSPLDDRGRPIQTSGQPADDHWRKFCSRCHLYSQRDSGPSAHGGGCVSCHVARNTRGTYEGKDRALSRNKPGYGQIHRLQTAIPSSQCLRCHNRSGRIGLTYTGLMESDQYGTPYQAGNLNAARLSGDRFVLHLTPDIHFEKGMHCVDCHLAREIMGDGKVYSRMTQQVEVRCQDCHGTEKAPPRSYTLRSEKDPLIWASAFTRIPLLKPGDRLLVSSQGQPFSNIRREKGDWVLYGKVDGRRHPLKIITKRPGVHALPGHSSSRFECFACHSRWAPQCYGCHDYRRANEKQNDVMQRTPTPGSWQETRDYYRFEDPPLGINQRSKVSPFMPGCQVLLTQLGPDNQPLPGWERRIYRREGFSGIVSGPINPHSTRKEVRSCPECHQNPKALGLGTGLFSPDRGFRDNRHLPLFGEEKNFPYSWESLITPNGRPLQSTSRPGARPFIPEELRKILRVGPCLPCHDSYGDPIYHDLENSYRIDRQEKHRELIRQYQKDLPK